jgi:hypothetical protein
MPIAYIYYICKNIITKMQQLNHYDDSKAGPYNRHKFKLIKNGSDVVSNKMPNLSTVAEESNNVEPLFNITMFSQFNHKNHQTASIGLPAIKAFNNKYKHYNKANNTTRSDSKTGQYLRELSLISLSPRPIALVKKEGISTDINIKYAII